jgi:protease YdgD
MAVALAAGVCARPEAPATASENSALQDGALAAVGRVWFDTGDVCGATLIAPRVAVTAAHCLFAGHQGRLRTLDSMWVQLDWEGGRPSQRRGVQAIGLHPGFRPGGAPNIARIAIDIALLGLAPSTSGAAVVPFLDVADANAILVGQRVSLVSLDASSGQRGLQIQSCTILSRIEGTVSLDCPGKAGRSGAPLLVPWGQGVGQVLGVVSSVGEDRGREVSLAALAGPTMAPLWYDLCNHWMAPDGWACPHGTLQPDSLWPW